MLWGTAVSLSLLANIDVDDLGRAAESLLLRIGVDHRQTFWRLCDRTSRCVFGDLSSQARCGYAGHVLVCTAARFRPALDPVHLDFVVPKIDAAVARAQSAGARLEGEVRTHKWGRIAVLADPFGHGFCLIEFLGRGYDEIAT